MLIVALEVGKGPLVLAARSIASKQQKTEKPEDTKGERTITRAANAPLVTLVGISIARLQARVADSQSSCGIESRIICRAFCIRGA